MREDIIKFLETVPAPQTPYQLRPGETIIDFEKWRKVNIEVMKQDLVKSAHYKACLRDLHLLNRQIKYPEAQKVYKQAIKKADE
jgi:hypothetical protein